MQEQPQTLINNSGSSDTTMSDTVITLYGKEVLRIVHKQPDAIVEVADWNTIRDYLVGKIAPDPAADILTMPLLHLAWACYNKGLYEGQYW